MTQTRHLVSLSVLLFGSCHLILFVSSTNSIQIVRRQCTLAVVTNMSYEQNQYKNCKSSSEACFGRKRCRKHHMQFLSQEMDHNSIHGPPHKSKPPPLVRTRGPIFTGNRLFSSTSYFLAKGLSFITITSQLLSPHLHINILSQTAPLKFNLITPISYFLSVLISIIIIGPESDHSLP